jgi:hypothetical protein
LRSAPDPRAADVLVAPNDFIPKGTRVRISDRCTLWTGSGRGALDADNNWCPVIYGGYRGWVNAYFLWTSASERLACVLQPDARGCGQRAER